jgi:hypothetical protein
MQKDPSTTRVPPGEYSSDAEAYSPPSPQTTSVVGSDEDVVPVPSGTGDVSIHYDAQEQATRRLIRRINDA